MDGKKGAKIEEQDALGKERIMILAHPPAYKKQYESSMKIFVEVIPYR